MGGANLKRVPAVALRLNLIFSVMKYIKAEGSCHYRETEVAFAPRMESRVQGFSVMGGLKGHVWDGVVADLWDISCGDKAEGYYLSPDCPRR